MHLAKCLRCNNLICTFPVTCFKIELENEICHLLSTHPVTVNIYLWIQFWNIPEIFQNVDYSTIWMCICYELFQKLEFKYQNQNSNSQVLVTQG